jgi:hypothetical protein
MGWSLAEPPGSAIVSEFAAYYTVNSDTIPTRFPAAPPDLTPFTAS